MTEMRRAGVWCGLCLVALMGSGSSLFAQQIPTIGYISPQGGQAGTVVEAKLGGYDWTPDMQIFSLDPRVKLEVLGPPGEVIVPEPPYWFGKKGRGSALPMPRETPVRLTLPADLPVGPIYWQAANANGATTRGVFMVSRTPEVIEAFRRKNSEVQTLPALPVIVSGQLTKIEEVDLYRFSVPKAGPVTCQIVAKRLNSAVRAIIQIRDKAGKMVADVVDSEHRDPAVTIAALAGEEYTVSIYDLDFRGDRAMNYRLEVTPLPQVLAAVPACGKRGESQSVTFVGYGIATGAAKLQTLARNIAFPATPGVKTWDCPVETAFGIVTTRMLLSDLPQALEPADVNPATRQLAIPGGVTGTLSERYGEDRYQILGDPMKTVWISAAAEGVGASLDLSVTIFDSKGVQVATNDDLAGTTDAGLLFKAPAAEQYQVVITDASGRSGSTASTYNLSVSTPQPDFAIKIPELLAIPVGGKIALPVTLDRREGYAEPVKIEVTGLPPGVTVTAPPDLTIAPGAAALSVELTSAATAPALAAMVTVNAAAPVAGQPATRTAGPVLVAGTLKPPFTIEGGGKDDVLKWPRGTAFPAPVTVERDPGFNGEIRLEMAGFNDRHRQGIRGPEQIVPPGAVQVIYPVTLPEWLETTRTSRIVLNGVAKIKDPAGNERFVTKRLLTRIGFLPGGALMKVGHKNDELKVSATEPFTIPLTISRSPQLPAPVKLELLVPFELEGKLKAEPMEVAPELIHPQFKMTPLATAGLKGYYDLTIRATTLKDGYLPVQSETTVTVEFV
ncbi:MAG: hypothetical protein JWN70_1235, partial [Planctomycetaceae bacterium]|nr:hypothetical protein [Planctomycetaceae bacterium]